MINERIHKCVTDLHDTLALSDPCPAAIVEKIDELIEAINFAREVETMQYLAKKLNKPEKAPAVNKTTQPKHTAEYLDGYCNGMKDMIEMLIERLKNES